MAPGPAPRLRDSLADVVPARTVLVYRNGDPHYPAHRVVLHRRRVPTLDALLLQLDEAVAPPFGVRALYTPRSGRLVHRLDELQPGACYVAAGPERFKKLDYLHIGTKKPLKKMIDVVKPVVHSAIRVPSRWQLFYNKPRNINVFTNGEVLVPPAKFLIPRFTLRNWDSVLALLNEKIFPRSGGVQRLYTLDGHAVHGSDKLEDNHYYVAGGKEKFKHLPYWCSPRVPPEVRRLYGGSQSSRKPRKKKSRSFHYPSKNVTYEEYQAGDFPGRPVPAEVVQEEEIETPVNSPVDED
ncbi:doublecortin domain-containing protein 2C isoform C [Alligator mississippiensis]|uniref:Doublecortin domain-containing protein 2C isoform C n=1 Tax=Alligator mississippiensis TaxID=8496 RepID=A0A151N8L9_ALLMI|nr:doublecortin domain-containing protein 2C isoform C [Alligator mississippiensis]